MPTVLTAEEWRQHEAAWESLGDLPERIISWFKYQHDILYLDRQIGNFPLWRADLHMCGKSLGTFLNQVDRQAKAPLAYLTGDRSASSKRNTKGQRVMDPTANKGHLSIPEFPGLRSPNARITRQDGPLTITLNYREGEPGHVQHQQQQPNRQVSGAPNITQHSTPTAGDRAMEGVAETASVNPVLQTQELDHEPGKHQHVTPKVQATYDPGKLRNPSFPGSGLGFTQQPGQTMYSSIGHPGTAYFGTQPSPSQPIHAPVVDEAAVRYDTMQTASNQAANAPLTMNAANPGTGQYSHGIYTTNPRCDTDLQMATLLCARGPAHWTHLQEGMSPVTVTTPQHVRDSNAIVEGAVRRAATRYTTAQPNMPAHGSEASRRPPLLPTPFSQTRKHTHPFEGAPPAKMHAGSEVLNPYSQGEHYTMRSLGKQVMVGTSPELPQAARIYDSTSAVELANPGNLQMGDDCQLPPRLYQQQQDGIQQEHSYASPQQQLNNIPKDLQGPTAPSSAQPMRTPSPPPYHDVVPPRMPTPVKVKRLRRQQGERERRRATQYYRYMDDTWNPREMQAEFERNMREAEALGHDCQSADYESSNGAESAHQDREIGISSNVCAGSSQTTPPTCTSDDGSDDNGWSSESIDEPI